MGPTVMPRMPPEPRSAQASARAASGEGGSSPRSGSEERTAGVVKETAARAAAARTERFARGTRRAYSKGRPRATVNDRRPSSLLTGG